MMIFDSRYLRCWADNINCVVVVDGKLQLFSDECRIHERYVNSQRFTYAVDGLTQSDVTLVLFQMIKGPNFSVKPRQDYTAGHLINLLDGMEAADNARRFLHEYQVRCDTDHG